MHRGNHWRDEINPPRSGILTKPKKAADLADLGGVACGMERQDDQILLARDRAEQGMRGGVRAEIFVAVLDVVDTARAALIELFEGQSERGKPARWVRTFRSVDFSGSVRDCVQEEFFAPRSPRWQGGSQFGGDDGKHKMFGNSHVFNAIEHRPLIERGANAGPLLRDVCRGREERIA